MSTLGVQPHFAAVTKVTEQVRQLVQCGATMYSSPTATVTGWTSPEFDGSKGNINVKGGYPYQCARSEPFYIRSAAWSPDDSTIYTASTGYHPWNLPTGSYPRSGLCDSAAAFLVAARSVVVACYRQRIDGDGPGRTADQRVHVQRLEVMAEFHGERRQPGDSAD